MTEKQRVFADSYLKCNDERKSAIMAGYSEKTADYYAKKLLKNSDIIEYIKNASESDSILDARQCKEVLSAIVSDESNTPSERMKAIDLLISIDEQPLESGNINISVNYGDRHES